MIYERVECDRCHAPDVTGPVNVHLGPFAAPDGEEPGAFRRWRGAELCCNCAWVEMRALLLSKPCAEHGVSLALILADLLRVLPEEEQRAWLVRHGREDG